MTVTAQRASRPVRAARPAEMSAATILGVSCSLKPPPGRSAAFSLLSFAMGTLANADVDVAMLDLRDARLPLFDGRPPAEREDERLRHAWRCVERAGGLFIAVPAYWAGVSGVFKNFVDTLCGPAYDLPQPVTTVFTRKPVALLVVGADEDSARAGTREAPRILTSAGARVVGSPVCVANPRDGIGDPGELYRRLVVLGAELGCSVHRREGHVG